MHYEVREDVPQKYKGLSIDTIMTSCEDFFNLHSYNTVPAEKTTISKLIGKLFKTHGKQLTRHEKRLIVYKKLFEKDHVLNTGELFHIPEQCAALKNNDVLNIICYREYSVEQKSVTCVIKCHPHRNVIIRVHGTDHSLNIRLPYSQATIDGLIRMSEEIRICKGVLSCEGLLGIKENWIDIVSEESSYRTRSSHCDKVLPWTGHTETCNKCLKLQSHHRLKAKNGSI